MVVNKCFAMDTVETAASVVVAAAKNNKHNIAPDMLDSIIPIFSL